MSSFPNILLTSRPGERGVSHALIMICNGIESLKRGHVVGIAEEVSDILLEIEDVKQAGDSQNASCHSGYRISLVSLQTGCSQVQLADESRDSSGLSGF